jgi:hypothetical protein
LFILFAEGEPARSMSNMTLQKSVQLSRAPALGAANVPVSNRAEADLRDIW